MSRLSLHHEGVVMADDVIVFKVKTPLALQCLAPVLTAREADTGLGLLHQDCGG